MNWTVTDMTPEMQQSAMQLAKQALKDSTDFNKVAQILKRDFGKKWGSDWQCVVTDQFDWLPSNWKTEKKAFIFFGIAKMAQHVNGGTLARQAPMAEAAVYIRGLVGVGCSAYTYIHTMKSSLPLFVYLLSAQKKHFCCSTFFSYSFCNCFAFSLAIFDPAARALIRTSAGRAHLLLSTADARPTAGQGWVFANRP
ncbi:Dynein light chain 1, cytoplasmic [Trichinella nelsoni]|uniref:Dynein light chain 1, cytoplasmic n=1 Tax=Trichinella nelsoni TaxID=6336 RepID=A0A0V0S3E9_9BILA|nr:Dynein light chain 1, cytoplasmic [Trichinella nelsoni]